MRGRKPKLDRPVVWKTQVPQSVYDKVIPLLPRSDLHPDKVAHGAMAELTTFLLKRWLKDQSQ